MGYKVVTVVGTRPELIKLSKILKDCDKFFNHVLVHTGQNYDYELNQVFFEDLDIRKPNYFLDCAQGSAAQTIANVISKVDEVFEQEKPDALVIYGDTNSCLCVIAAKRKQIPIFHLEAGNRCFDQRVPEEINRKIVDHLSDVNMVHSEHARRYLIDEGIPPEKIFKTGSPMVEVLKMNRSKIEDSEILSRLNLESKGYFLVSIHREENVDYRNNFQDLLSTLNSIADVYKIPVIVSTHPRTRKKLDTLDIKFNDLIQFMKPLGFNDYIKLQLNSKCVLSDSGTITEEASILKFPAVMIRQAHERPEGMDSGILIMSGLKSERVLDSINIAISDNYEISDVEDYSFEQVSQQVIKIVQSYTDYIDRTVWRKDHV